MSVRINTIDFWRIHLIVALTAVLMIVGQPHDAEANNQIQVAESVVASLRSADQAASILFNRALRAHANGEIPFAQVQAARERLRKIRKALKEAEKKLHILRARAENRRTIYRNNGYRWTTAGAGRTARINPPVEPNSHLSNTFPGCSVCAYERRVNGIKKRPR